MKIIQRYELKTTNAKSKYVAKKYFYMKSWILNPIISYVLNILKDLLIHFYLFNNFLTK